MRAAPKVAALCAITSLLAAACSPAGRLQLRTVSAPERPPTPSDPAYTVRLGTGAAGHVWRGVETISFTNTGPSPLARVWLRLWANGVVGCDPLAIVITRVGRGSVGPMELDCTAVPVDLASPIPSGSRGSFELGLRIVIPERNDRFGYQHGLNLVGNAIPTVAVNDDRGWHLDPYVHLGESFYSVVGRYEVTLSVPDGMDTPSTGVPVRHRTSRDRVITTYVARRVRDFAWAAGALARVTDTSNSSQVRVWYQPGSTSRSQATTVLSWAVDAMNTFSSSFGAYPYPEVDVVVSEFATFGGMEYPTLVFANANRVTVTHELSHQWWYGIVGNDEFAEPWLDESFATWSESLPYAPWRNCSSYSWPSATARLTNDMAYWRDHPTEYRTVYGGGGCLLAHLAHRFGVARFVELLREYAADHWLGIARTRDFKAAVEEAAATELPGFDADAFWSHWRVG